MGSLQKMWTLVGVMVPDWEVRTETDDVVVKKSPDGKRYAVYDRVTDLGEFVEVDGDVEALIKRVTESVTLRKPKLPVEKGD